MDKEKEVAPAVTHPKKEMRRQLAEKIKTAIPELKPLLSDKKLNGRIKKAVKILTEGLHKDEAEKTVKKALPKGTVAAKKAAAPKASAKKAATTQKAVKAIAKSK